MARGLATPDERERNGRAGPLSQEATLADSSKKVRDQAEARFEKTQKAAKEGAKARAQYEAEALAIRAKTARLRSLRLAKEAADREAAVGKAAEKPAKKS
jgi:hypothetical protein